MLSSTARSTSRVGVPNNEGDGDVVVQPNHHPPRQVLHHEPVFVLSAWIHFPKVVVLQEVVHHTNDEVGTLAVGHINKLVDLYVKGLAMRMAVAKYLHVFLFRVLLCN